MDASNAADETSASEQTAVNQTEATEEEEGSAAEVQYQLLFICLLIQMQTKI